MSERWEKCRNSVRMLISPAKMCRLIDTTADTSSGTCTKPRLQRSKRSVSARIAHPWAQE